MPNTIARGQSVPVGIEYNLVSEQQAEMELSLMSWNWRTHEATQVCHLMNLFVLLMGVGCLSCGCGWVVRVYIYDVYTV